jgi:hypothetical protein
VSAGNVLISGVISATANITGGNVLTAGLISATANITGGNVLTAGLISASANIVTASSLVVGAGSGGNITGANVIGANVLSASGNITSNSYISALNNLVINSNTSEGGQLILTWANISGITAQANSTWNMDVDNNNLLRVFYQNATAATNVLITANASSNIVTLSTVFKSPTTTFASLPTAATAGAGARAFITDANLVTFGTVVGGGGSNNMPVFSNGTNWLVG